MMATIILYVIGVGTVALILLICFDIITRLTTDLKIRLPGPQAIPLIGNLYLIVKKGVADFDKEMAERYGIAVRFYEGRRLNIMLTDSDEIKRVLVQRSSLFPNRQVFEAANIPPICYGLPSLRDEEWSRARFLCSRFFTDASLSKMLQMLQPLLRELTDKFAMSKQQGEAINVERVFSEFAAKCLAVLFFGAGSLDDTEIGKLTKALNELRNPAHKELKFAALVLCPKANCVMDALNCHLVDREKLVFLANHVKKTIENYESTTVRDSYNFITFACEARDEDGKGLSFENILGQAITFYVAGQHTISSALSFGTYHVTIDEDIQQRVATEAAATAVDDLASIGASKLLGSIILETLRMYPPSVRIDRVAKQDTSTPACPYIPAGTTMIIPLPAIHNHVDNPRNFDPSRSSLHDSVGNFQFMPFGRGPRYCIGKRLAMMIMIATLASLFTEIRFQRSSLTEVPLRLKKKSCNRTENGIWLKAFPRMQRRE